MRLWSALPAIVLLASCEAADAPASGAPLELTGRVVDAADIIPERIEADLTGQLSELEDRTLAQMVIVTTPDLQGRSIEEFGMALGNGWGIGDAERNDGILLIVAPNDRRVRIEVGTGLETVLTDELCAAYIDRMLPSLKQGDYLGAIMIGTDLIEARLLETSVTPVTAREMVPA